MKGLRLAVVFTCVVLALGIMGIKADVVQAEEVTLYWASFLPKNHPETKDVQKYYMDKVNERAKGQLVIKYRGGPEVIAPPNLGTAVKNGVVDIGTIFVGVYEAIVPGVGGLMLTELTPDEERQTGAIDYIVKLHQKHGLMFLGRAAPTKDNFFYFFLNKKVEKLEDFKKMKLGTATALRAAAKAWGASVTPLKLSQYYSAMERNLVDGVPGCPIPTWVAFGAHEVTKYVLDHQFYQSTAVAIMNSGKWNKLPDNLKKIMNDAMVEFQKEKMVIGTKGVAWARKKMMDSGVEFYKFPPKDAEWLVNTANDAAWAYQNKRFPEVTKELKKRLTK
jgi:TRAP-type transport system periplasmic protein